MRQIAFVLLIIAFISCREKPDFLKSFGPTQTETRELGNFQTLEFGFNTEVVLTQDSSKPQSISITYGKNLLSKIKTEIRNNTLFIEDKNTFNWVRKLNVRLKCTLNLRGLRTINIHGAADLRSSSAINLPFLDIVSDGVGLIDLNVKAGILTLNTKNPGTSIFRGRADILSVSLENGHALDAYELDTDDAYVFQYSTRDCYVNSENILGAKLYGKGNLYYRRTPAVSYNVQANGEGKAVFKP